MRIPQLDDTNRAHGSARQVHLRFASFTRLRRAFELDRALAGRDAEDEASVGDVVEHRDVLGDAHWSIEWQEQHCGADGLIEIFEIEDSIPHQRSRETPCFVTALSRIFPAEGSMRPSTIASTTVGERNPRMVSRSPEAMKLRGFQICS